MKHTVLDTFTNRKGKIYRLVEFTVLERLTSGYKYYIDSFNGKEFIKETINGHFKDIQPAKQHFSLLIDVDHIIKKREEEYSNEDCKFELSLKGTEFEKAYNLLKSFTIKDIESPEYCDYDEPTIYIVDMNDSFSRNIPELQYYNVTVHQVSEIHIRVSDHSCYFAIKFKNGTGRSIINTRNIEHQHKHDKLFISCLKFASYLC